MDLVPAYVGPRAAEVLPGCVERLAADAVRDAPEDVRVLARRSASPPALARGRGRAGQSGAGALRQLGGDDLRVAAIALVGLARAGSRPHAARGRRRPS